MEDRLGIPGFRITDYAGVVSDVDSGLCQRSQIFGTEGSEVVGIDFRGPAAAHQHVVKADTDFRNEGMPVNVLGGSYLYG